MAGLNTRTDPGRCHAPAPPTPRWRHTWRARTAQVWSASSIRRPPETTRTRTNGPSPRYTSRPSTSRRSTPGTRRRWPSGRRRRSTTGTPAAAPPNWPGTTPTLARPTARAATCSTTTTNGGGLAKVQLHLQTGDSAALVRAKEIFDLVRSGWDTDSAHAAPGGVFWTQANWSQDRNTVSNMPGAQLALRLHQITGEDGYLDWARRFYDWTNTYLQSPGGLYWDHLDLKGTVEKTIWSYNQGVPVGVNVLLYKATHDRTYLRRAERIARAAYAYYVTQGRLFTQPVYFNSIFFKNLLLLESVTGDGKYHQAMADYADELWSTMRDPGTGLVHFDSSGGTEAIQQAAFAQLYAVLAWPRELWPTLY
ncbi:glycoside hydrolase family 76 protein [Streptomyces sp. NPDC088253]|uniref:glycoside hydrolase family 76 protein n=1 Tax=Streptomyces sp. NPDC088253 TaxID=3365846 RepID=UPI0038290F4B